MNAAPTGAGRGNLDDFDTPALDFSDPPIDLILYGAGRYLIVVKHFDFDHYLRGSTPLFLAVSAPSVSHGGRRKSFVAITTVPLPLRLSRSGSGLSLASLLLPHRINPFQCN